MSDISDTLKTKLDFYESMPRDLINDAEKLNLWLDSNPTRRQTYYVANMALIDGRVEILDTLMARQGCVRCSYEINSWTSENVYQSREWIYNHKIPMISFDVDEYFKHLIKYKSLFENSSDDSGDEFFENIELRIEEGEQFSSISNLVYSNCAYSNVGERVIYDLSDSEPEHSASSVFKTIPISIPAQAD